MSIDDDTMNDEPIDIIANNLEKEVVDESMIFMVGRSIRFGRAVKILTVIVISPWQQM